MVVIHNEDMFFGCSTASNLFEEMNIGIRCFGSQFITPLAVRTSFQEKNAYSFHSLKVHGHVVGYFSLFRFKPEFLECLLTGTALERDITVQDVLPFERQEVFDVYIDVIIVDPALPHHRRNLYAGILLAHFVQLILQLHCEGYHLRHLYAVTTTQEGARIVPRFGFQQLPQKSFVPGRIAWKNCFQEEGLALYETLNERLSSHRVNSDKQ
jgi:hypothetical protein